MIGPRVQSKIRFALDEPLTVLSIDDGIESLLGFGNEEFLTSRVSLKDRIHPEDADIAGMLFTPGSKKKRDPSTSACVTPMGGFAASGGSTAKNAPLRAGKRFSICCCRTRRACMKAASSQPA
jgi:hypothetical protein